MRLFLLHDSHPYVRHFYYDVRGCADGTFQIVYRDFDSVKQEDGFFQTEEDAIRYGELLQAYCAVIDLDYYGDRFTDNEKFWHTFNN